MAVSTWFETQRRRSVSFCLLIHTIQKTFRFHWLYNRMGNSHTTSSDNARRRPLRTYKLSDPIANHPPIGTTATAPPNNNNSSSTSMASSLPYATVDSTLRALAGQAEGFGRSAIGGLHGSLYHVTTLAGSYTRFWIIRARIDLLLILFVVFNLWL